MIAARDEQLPINQPDTLFTQALGESVHLLISIPELSNAAIAAGYKAAEKPAEREPEPTEKKNYENKKRVIRERDRLIPKH